VRTEGAPADVWGRDGRRWEPCETEVEKDGLDGISSVVKLEEKYVERTLLRGAVSILCLSERSRSRLQIPKKSRIALSWRISQMRAGASGEKRAPMKALNSEARCSMVTRLVRNNDPFFVNFGM
jgi:hypothetical protein